MLKTQVAFDLHECIKEMEPIAPSKVIQESMYFKVSNRLIQKNQKNKNAILDTLRPHPRIRSQGPTSRLQDPRGNISDGRSQTQDSGSG